MNGREKVINPQEKASIEIAKAYCGNNAGEVIVCSFVQEISSYYNTSGTKT